MKRHHTEKTKIAKKEAINTGGSVHDDYWIVATTIASIFSCNDFEKLYRELKFRFSSLENCKDKAKIFTSISSELSEVIGDLIQDHILE